MLFCFKLIKESNVSNYYYYYYYYYFLRIFPVKLPIVVNSLEFLYFSQGFWPDFPSETFKWEEVDANDPEQINDEKDVDQYGQNEMDGKGDAKLANIHGKGKQTIRLVEADQ